MTAGRICTRDVDFAEARESVRAVAERMHQRNVGSIVIVDAHRRPHGVVTDRDLVLRVLSVDADPKELVASDVMSAPVATVTEDTPVRDLLHRMVEAACRRLIVVGDSGAVTGLISLDDILRHLADEFDAVRVLISAESPESLAKE